MTRGTRRAALAGVIACGAIALGARPAQAHLMAARHGTVNVVGAAVYTVASVPASSLHGADDDHDGILDAAELQRHEAELREEIDRRLVVLDGTQVARTVRVDLLLSPDHGAAGDRADQIIVLKHAVLDAPPADLRVRCDLFGARASERELSMTATRHPASGTETDVGVLTPETTELAFFPRTQDAPLPAAVQRASPGGLGGLLGTGAVLVLAMALGGRARALSR